VGCKVKFGGGVVRLWEVAKCSFLLHCNLIQTCVYVCVCALKDKDFGKGSMHRPHVNPNAEVSTTMKIYDHYSLDRAYMGETFFWGLTPLQGDTVSFKFSPPIYIEKYG